MKLLAFMLFVTFFLAVSCTEHRTKRTRKEGAEVYAINNKTKNTGLFSIDSIILNDSYEFIPLETKSESLISDVSFYAAVDSVIIIGDQTLNKILIFTKSGRFLRKIGTYGKGPNEFNRILDMRYNKYKKTIDVIDITPKMMSFDLLGNVVSIDYDGLTKYAPSLFYPVGRNIYSLYNNFDFSSENAIGERNFNFIISTDKGKEIDSYLPFHGKVEVPTGNRQFFEANNGKLKFFETCIPQIYEVDSTGLRASYFLDFEGVDINNYFNEDFFTNYESKYRKVSAFLNEVYESNRYLFINSSIDRIRNYVIYDKIDKKTLISSGSGYFVKNLLLPIINCIYYNGDKSVVPVDAVSIIKVKKIFNDPRNRAQAMSDGLKKIMALNIKNDSNPVLMLFKIKE